MLGICAYNDVTECGEHIKKVTLTENKRIPVRDFYVIYRMTCALWNKIFIRETIWKNRIRFIGDISYGEDARFVQQYLRSCKENEWLLFIDKELYNYRACASGLSHPNFEKYWEQECGLFYYTVETLMILNPDITVFEPQLSENCLRIVEVAIQLLFKSNKRIVDKYQKFKEIISSDVFEKATNSCRITRFNKLHHFLIRHRLIQGLFVYYMICIK